METPSPGDARGTDPTTLAVLSSPLRIGRLDVAGRVFRSATSETRASEDGFVGDALLALYEPLAVGRTPLIITGNTYPRLDGRSTARMMGADADDKVPGLTRLTETVHRHGSLIFAQISHCGRQVTPGQVGRGGAVSASAVKEPVTGTRPRALTGSEVAGVVTAYAEAAERCRRAGFDGVQIHAAHGYLVNQFLTPHTNRRRDVYGGSFEARLRFLREVFRATRERVGADWPIILKLNGSDALPGRRGLGTPALVEIALRMEDEGVDAIEVSVGHYESGMAVSRGSFGPFFRGMLRHGGVRDLGWIRRVGLRSSWRLLAFAFDRLWPYEEGFNLEYARAFKRSLRIPILCVGGWQDPGSMASAVAGGACDAVSCARTMLADPFFVRNLEAGVPGPRCVFCNACAGVIGRLPVDCYHPDVRPEKDRMLAAAGFPSEGQAGGAR